MKKLILFAISLTLAFGQQGKYERKSISSLGSIWYQANSVGNLNFDSKRLNKFLEHYVEVERFDYNVLPQPLLIGFRSEANRLPAISADALSRVLEKTVASKIVEILNDEALKMTRGQDLKDEAADQTFAGSKAKSLGLTTDELKTLLNSAYVYLPYIQSARKEVSDNSLSITIEGGIIWWQLKTDADGNTSFRKVLDVSTSGISSLNPNARNSLTGMPRYTSFQFGSEVWSTSPEQYAQNDAMLAFCKNLGVKTKEINDFKLSAQIMEATGKKYGFNLGFKEGVHLDDIFELVEIEENSDGDEVTVKKGVIRVSKTGDNLMNPIDYSYATQLLGNRVSEGTVVLEHPRLGLDLRVKLGTISGLSIDKGDIPAGLIGDQNLFEEDITAAFGADIFLSYNLAPVIGISQTFLDVNLTFALPMATYNTELDQIPSIVPFILSGYTGATKKLWLGSHNISVFAGVGVESLNLSGTLLFVNYTYSVRAAAAKIAVDYEKLITADMSVNVGFQYKYAFPPTQLVLKFGSDEFTYQSVDVAFWYPDLNLSAMAFNLGVNYALGELPINLFGFLDPYKKY